MLRLNQTAEAPDAGIAMIEHAIKVVIDALKEMGIRDDYSVLVGGAPLNEQAALAVGADIYCPDASVAAETVKALMASRSGACLEAAQLTGSKRAATRIALKDPGRTDCHAK